MLFRTIASAFFLESSTLDDLADLVARAGVTEVVALDEQAKGALGFDEPDRQVLGGKWGAFGETWAVVDEVDRLCCLQLYSPATRYLDAARAARDRDEANGGQLSAYVRTFRDACLALSPGAAFLDTLPHYEDVHWDEKQGSRAFVLEQAPLVALGDADALVRRFFSVLFLDTEMAARWTPDPPRFDRELVKLPTGLLIFAGSGSSRMA